MIELVGVAKAYGRQDALKPIHLTAAPGRTTVLIGPSGCGKSTILRLIAGLIAPDGGTIRFGGVEITESNILKLRQRMGYVIQDGGLFPHLTARDNITLMARHLKRSPADVARRVDELSALTRFPGDGLDRFPVQLSGGQRQRVSLMRALMLDPDLLLLDEPLGALDPMIRSELQADLREIFQRLKKTVLMVTHDMAEAGFFGDRIVLMRRGSVVQEGSLAELMDAPADPFVTQFIKAQRAVLSTTLTGGGA
jgi:osmoprotectant transport system ATP-binding protein